jgi:hypothetical protein
MEITLPDQIKLYFDKAGLGNPTFIFIHGGGADTFPSPKFCSAEISTGYALLFHKEDAIAT